MSKGLNCDETVVDKAKMLMKPYQAVTRRSTLIGRILLLAGIFELSCSEVVEVCVSDDLRISCPSNQIIFVTRAEFGRMEVGRCIKKPDKFIGCTNDVLHILDRWCSGRQMCSFEVTNDDELEEANTNCLDILMKYLRMEYSCLRVEARCTANRPSILSSKTGYISTSVVDTKGCGSTRSPWIISADPGQTIKLNLIDFAANQQSYNMISCRHVYGFIVERSLGINTTICGGQSREREIYTSKTNSVEIAILQDGKRNKAHFVLRFSVSGCPEIVPPTHAWYKREQNEALIGCENSDKEWRLKCIDNKWIGDVGNCSQIVTVVKEHAQPEEVFHISSIVVISGIAGAAVVLSVIAIVSGVVYINKYRMKQEVKRANLFKTYSTIGSNMQAYYRPVTGDQSENSAACWDMSLLANNQMTLLSDKCTCPTLQMRNTGEGDRAEGDRSLERQSLYSSIRST